MAQVNVQKHKSLVLKLEELLTLSLKMKQTSQDDLLRQFIEECESWLAYTKVHTDDEELSSLKREIGSRFYERYNVRIEPKDLDNERLALAEEIIEEFDAI